VSYFGNFWINLRRFSRIITKDTIMLVYNKIVVLMCAFVYGYKKKNYFIISCLVFTQYTYVTCISKLFKIVR
jgi:hypothetical protein